jgi:hypothetical protein
MEPTVVLEEILGRLARPELLEDGVRVAADLALAVSPKSRDRGELTGSPERHVLACARRERVSLLGIRRAAGKRTDHLR